MSSSSTLCQFCRKDQFKYTCPKCNALYCSVDCYKAQEHLNCSEEFYKSCIQEKLTTSEPSSRDEMKKMYDILKRIRETDAGLEPDFADPVDSDDDAEDDNEAREESVLDEDDDETQDVDDIAARLQNVDINDANEVWERLTSEERAEFKKMVECGDIMKLLPGYKPWWIASKKPKIVEIKSVKDNLHDYTLGPVIEKNIPKFSIICKKTPSPCLHYNLWNIMCSYACMVRYFNGEHLTNPNEAVAHLVNLSLTLKFGTNFEEVEDALVSVEMEALTTKIVGVEESVNREMTSSMASREQLQSDARSLMASCHNKLTALSDIYRLMAMARNNLKQSKTTKESDFYKLFAVCNGSIELDRKKLQFLSKKIEFLLSYVNRENEEKLE
ncbi:unnamed protein product [Ceratitis capitata]|uniref:(Mediterranean fruit fly) hypothetical protein n=1 Tax=Ceratitis capitata TaxID=7213 RepID=W8C800_CERCA|nr:unnamed protein product [Ceratitis capitata]